VTASPVEHDLTGVMPQEVVHGLSPDLTSSLKQARGETVNGAVAEIAESRAVIERAKGMLMLVYRIDADSASELLKWRSQETNIKLYLLAEQIAADFQALSYGNLPPPSAYHRLLLSAHLRVDGATRSLGAPGKASTPTRSSACAISLPDLRPAPSV
jgi:hypothetical protein